MAFEDPYWVVEREKKLQELWENCILTLTDGARIFLKETVNELWTDALTNVDGLTADLDAKRKARNLIAILSDYMQLKVKLP